MTLEETIVNLLKMHHRGIGSPIKLEVLLDWLCEYKYIEHIDKNSERRVRKIISRYEEICNVGEGYYWVRPSGHPEDVQAVCDYIERTYWWPLREKISRIKAKFPQYYPNHDPRQRGLFS